MSNELIKEAYEHFKGVWPYAKKVNMVRSTGMNSYFESGVFKPILMDMNVVEDNREWDWVGTESDFHAYGESLKKEWKPEIGRECEYSYCDGEYRKCLVMGFFDELAWMDCYQYEKDGLTIGSHQTLYMENLKFRPLKKESKKDKFVKNFMSLLENRLVNTGHPSFLDNDKMTDRLRADCEFFYDKGLRFKGGE